jgi:DNA-binding FadR family transcriptional regulator
MSFHTAVILASHNKAIIEINTYLADWLRVAREEFFHRTSVHETGLHDHREILEKIRLRDAEGAGEKMKEHLARARKVIEEEIKDAP